MWEFDYFISLMRLVECFLFSLLSMRVLLASAASWFGCVAILSLYFSAYLPISSLTVDIFKSLHISSFQNLCVPVSKKLSKEFSRTQFRNMFLLKTSELSSVQCSNLLIRFMKRTQRKIHEEQNSGKRTFKFSKILKEYKRFRQSLNIYGFRIWKNSARKLSL